MAQRGQRGSDLIMSSLQGLKLRAGSFQLTCSGTMIALSDVTQASNMHWSFFCALIVE